jgi:hypothetical protein
MAALPEGVGPGAPQRRLPGDEDAACRGAGHADRITAQDAEGEGPGRENVLAGPAASAGGAGRRPELPERADRTGSSRGVPEIRLGPSARALAQQHGGLATRQGTLPSPVGVRILTA